MNTRARNGLLSLLLLLSAVIPIAAGAAANSCDRHVAQWLDPASGELLESGQVFSRLADSRIVLLGEAHTTRAHHRWQHYMLSALHSRNSNMMVGFEMLPRRVQSALDGWSAGTLSEQEFLDQSEWRDVWGYDAGLYLPLLHFVRLNRLPAVALNVDRELVSRVGREGWQALDEQQRMGLSDPAAASDGYRESLAQLYAYKQSYRQSPDADDITEPSAAELEAVKLSDDFSNFVDAQLTWDRAMAEALAAAHRRDPSAIVVGIVGRGHLEYGYGIPHQLAAMGIDDVDVLLPIGADDICDPLPLDLATAVFVVDSGREAAPPARPRLGIIIESGETAVRVMQVVDDSVAAASGIRQGDLIQSAAGFDTRSNRELIDIIQRQAPGTWLPLRIIRDGKTIELTARFPQKFE